MSDLFLPHILERAAFGSLPGISALQLTGYNGGVTSTHEPVWDESATYAFLAANMSSPTVSSSSANDTSAGTGARTVTITGVNASYEVVSETKTLNGQTGVALTSNFMSINKIEVATAGSGGTNAGIIYVGTGNLSTGKPDVVHGLVAASRSVSTSFIYTVPASYTLLMLNLECLSVSATAGILEANLETIVDGVSAVVKKSSHLGGFQNTFPHRTVFTTPKAFAAKTQLQLQAKSSAGTGPVYARADCLLVQHSLQKLF